MRLGTLVRRSVLAGLLAATCSVAPAGLAEDLDPDALFESAKTAYGEKKYGKALADLRLLVGEVGRRRVLALQDLLPAAPAGYTAGEVESGDLAGIAMGMGTTLKRRYTKGDAEISVDLSVDSPMIAGFAMAMNPMFAQAAGHTIVRVKGRQAMIEGKPGEGSATLRLLLASNTALLQVTGPARADVESLASATDLDRLEKALQE
jgi:hypothetical protein